MRRGHTSVALGNNRATSTRRPSTNAMGLPSFHPHLQCWRRLTDVVMENHGRQLAQTCPDTSQYCAWFILPQGDTEAHDRGTNECERARTRLNQAPPDLRQSVAGEKCAEAGSLLTRSLRDDIPAVPRATPSRCTSRLT